MMSGELTYSGGGSGLGIFFGFLVAES